jgi:hypothetical protein
MTHGLIYIALGSSALLAFLIFIGNIGDRHRSMYATIGASVMMLIFVVIGAVTACSSYGNYIDIKTYRDSKYMQDFSTIMEFNNIISQSRGKQSEITDLKFQGFQENVAYLIRNHRNNIIKYNERIMGKRIMAKNCLVGFLIFNSEEDMKPLPFVPAKYQGEEINAQMRDYSL